MPAALIIESRNISDFPVKVFLWVAVKIDNRLEAISIFYILSITDTVDVKPVPSLYHRDVKRYFR